MDKLFLQTLNMSITASYVILFVVILRLCLKKTPKIFSYALWSVVLFRLVCPFSFESFFSLIPINTQAVPQSIIYQQSPQVQSGFTVIDQTVNNSLPAPTIGASVNPLQIWMAISEAIWLIGISCLIIYSIVTTIKLYNSVKSARHMTSNIYELDGIKTPFVFGIIKPKIYLPPQLSDNEKVYILKHEQTHIKRLDHIIKPFAFLVLCVHWFNPLAWVAFSLMGEDMELSCDESVIKQLGNNIKKSYSSSLLALSTNRHIVGGCPLAFGESNIKGRIKNILNYKKPAFWVVILVAVVVVTVCIGLLFNPKDDNLDLSFLDPNNLISSVIDRDNVRIDVYEMNKYTYLTGQQVGGWIDQTKWREKKVSSPYELSPTYIIENIKGDTIRCEIRLYESEPTLAMVLYGNEWRYYTINKEAYNNLHMLILTRSYFEPYSISKIGDVDAPIVVDITLDGLFETLMSNPQTSSNPGDYIKANQTIFDEIVRYGNSALIYCFALFEQGRQTDLKGHLLMAVCRSLCVDEDIDLSVETGQEWYDAFKKNAVYMRDKLGLHEMEKHMPKSYLLLQMLDGKLDNVKQEIRLPDFKYTGNDSVLKLVYDTELSQYKGHRQEDGFLIPAVHLHGSYKEENKLKVFVTVYNGIYRLFGKELKDIGGSIVPIAITYVKNENNDYILEKYEQAQDGGLFSSSIEKYCTMPVSNKKISDLANKIITHYSDYSDLRTLQTQNLTEHLKTYNQVGVSLVTDYDNSIIPLT